MSTRQGLKSILTGWYRPAPGAPIGLEERCFLLLCAVILMAHGGRAAEALREAWSGPYAGARAALASPRTPLEGLSAPAASPAPTVMEAHAAAALPVPGRVLASVPPR